jgi:RNA polymerase sigma-70 factor, ECF subfamily
MPRDAARGQETARPTAPRRGEIEDPLTRVAEGDERALAALYDRTSPWVYGLALRILKDPAAAEEVVLDVYLQVWRRAGAFSRERGSPASWLLTIARTRAIDRLRAGTARREREARFEPAFDAPGDAVDPASEAAEGERRSIVHRALRSLPAEQKRAIELAYFGGLTHVEIAERLGEPLGTVKTRIRLGISKLRESLSPFEDS